jgi:choline kinase
MKKPSIYIGVATSGIIKAATTQSLVRTVARLVVKGYPTVFGIHESCYVHNNRNQLFAKAHAQHVDYLMFVDSDMEFGPDDIEKLLLQKKEIIGGLYYSRGEPSVPFAFKVSKEDGRLKIIKKEELPKETFECDAVATGFMLIDMKVFNKMKPPFFFYGDPVLMPELGDDMYFCLKAKHYGVKVFCDPTIDLGHIGNKRY